jgi:putative peptidoglycan lipid II flippase
MAARLPSGSVAGLAYGIRIVNFVVGAGALALGTAILPHFAAMVTRRDWSGLWHTIRVYSRLILVGGSIAAFVMYALSPVIVQLIYQRGAFTSGDAATVSRVQAFAALQVPFYLIGTLMVRLAFALRRSHVLLFGAVISIALKVALNYIFMLRLGVAGIALSTSCVYLVSAGFLWLMLLRPLRGSQPEGVHG